MDQISKINKYIKQLNIIGRPIIFIVTGINGTGKTLVTRELLRQLDFYQTYNLGLISKTIKYFKPDLEIDSIDNFDSKNNTLSIFTELIKLQVASYNNTGVNAIFEGVQIDTRGLAEIDTIIGGVILMTDHEKTIERGNKPETHFKRVLSSEDFSNIENEVRYKENEKFLAVDNNGQFEKTLVLVLNHLENLLIKELTT